jgi:type I restriction enzyme R subunit
MAMSLVDIFIRTNQARKILFVADRDALVKQARVEGFQAFIPDEPCERIWTHNVDDVKKNRLFVVTLQTLSRCFEQFTPAFFDLIIFDEVHRSIFNRWNEVLHYFDGRMIGLTATPADFIDRNTFLEFDCPDEMPTFLYEYECCQRLKSVPKTPTEKCTTFLNPERPSSRRRGPSHRNKGCGKPVSHHLLAP